MADIIYTVKDKPYFNITNQCPNACTFCLRTTGGRGQRGLAVAQG